VEQISERAVREALAAVRYARSIDSPLSRLAVVRARLGEEGAVVTPENAAWALAAVLQSIVWQELERLRGGDGWYTDRVPGAARGPDALTPDNERALLVADFRAGNAELEAWSTLWVRFLSTASIGMADVPDLVGTSRATLARRLNAAVVHLTDRLREHERAARLAEASRPGASAVERIVVADGPAADAAGGAGGAGVGDTTSTAAALLATVRDDTRIVRLSRRHLSEIARLPAADLTAYRLGRVAEWSQPRHRLDERFVDLTLLLDHGDEAGVERWQAQPDRLGGLRQLLDEVPDPVIVVLGPPGAGKSTMLRRMELDLAAAGLRGETDVIPFLVQLGLYRAEVPGGTPPSPGAWLAAQWTARCPGLPAINDLLRSHGVVLLLDALNEMPHRDQAEYRDLLRRWKQFVQDVAALGRGSRVLLTCRSLDYSTPLSTPGLRVPQARLVSLTDAQVESFLQAYLPARAQELWARLRGTARLELVRTPYFLKLLVEHLTAGHEVPVGRAALFTGFVRQAVRREVRRDNRLFLPGTALGERDYNRVLRARHWKTPHELPSRSPLFPQLAGLAFRMQRGEPLGEAAQVWADYDAALEMLGAGVEDRHDADPADLIRAGVALGILDEDFDRDQVLFFHQLLQEYFAGRYTAENAQPELVRGRVAGRRAIAAGCRAAAGTWPGRAVAAAAPHQLGGDDVAGDRDGRRTRRRSSKDWRR